MTSKFIIQTTAGICYVLDDIVKSFKSQKERNIIFKHQYETF